MKLHEKIEFHFETQSGAEVVKEFQGYNTRLTDDDLSDIARDWLKTNAFSTEADPITRVISIDKEQNQKQSVKLTV